MSKVVAATKVIKVTHTHEEVTSTIERLKGIRYDLQTKGRSLRIKESLPGAGTHMEAQAMGISRALEVLEEML